MVKYFIFFVALVLIYAGVSYIRLLYVVNQAHNVAILPQSAVWGSGQPLRYIAAGDSTAVGIGASREEETYPYKVAQFLAKNHQVTYKNIAVSGAKTQDVIAVQLPLIISFNPDVVTISVGANDATHLRSNLAIFENYQQIIKILLSKTQAQIYLTNIPHFTGATLLPQLYIYLLEAKSQSLNNQLDHFNSSRVHVVNIHDFGWDKFPDLRPTYSADQFHPSDIGYNNWAEAFKALIR